MTNEKLAAEVRAELGRRRMSHSALARRVGCTQMYMHRRLNGEVAFTVLELAEVAEVLDVPVEKFLSGAA